MNINKIIKFSTIVLLIFLFIWPSRFAYSNQRCTDFFNPLVNAADCGRADLVLSLLEAGFDSNAIGQFGATGLMRASYRGYENIVKILLDAGANPNVVDIGGASAMHIAGRAKHDAIVYLLLNYGANPLVQDSEGYQPNLLFVNKPIRLPDDAIPWLEEKTFAKRSSGVSKPETKNVLKVYRAKKVSDEAIQSDYYFTYKVIISGLKDISALKDLFVQDTALEIEYFYHQDSESEAMLSGFNSFMDAKNFCNIIKAKELGCDVVSYQAYTAKSP